VIVGNNWGIESWTYSYNNHGDKVKILHQAKVPGKQYSCVETIQYIYDQNGNWTRKMHYVDNNLKTWTEREILYAVSDSDYDKIVEETKKMEAESKAISNMVFSHIKHRQDSIQAVQLAVAEEEEASGHIYEGPEVLAHFPRDYIGGAENFMKWLGNQTFENEGHADVSFVVECDGSITCVKIVRSSGDDAFNNEAVRIVKSMPKWIPGYQNGQAVRSRFRIPIKVGY
jgi:TonB family protein